MAAAGDIEDEEGGSGFSLADLVGVVRRRWMLIAAAIVAVGALAAVVAVSLPSRYEASATIQIDPRKKTIVNVENVVADLRADQTTVESEVEILHSKALALRVIEALDLRHHPDFTQASWPRRLLARIGLAQIPPEPPDREIKAIDGLVFGSRGKLAEQVPQRDAIVAVFERRVKVARVRNTLLIEVKASSGDAVLAARIANTLVEVYLKEQIAAKVKAHSEAAELIEHKLEGLRQKVYDAERKIAGFKAEHNIFDAEGQLLSEKQLARLMEQTVLARNVTAESKAKYEQVQQMLRQGQKGSIADVLQSHTIRLFKDQYVKATRREAELLTKYGPKHPEMVKARAEVADIEAQLATEVEKIVANLETEYRVAEERERGLTASLGGLKDLQVISKEAAVHLRELERDASTSKQIFESFLQRYKQTTETQDLQIADSRIVERADIPLSVASPKRMQIAAIGAFAGLALGFGMALLLEFMKPGLMRPEEVEAILGLPHLASVPMLRRTSDGLGDPEQAIRAVVAVPNGVFAESVRAARHSIDSRRRSPAPRVILVTSAMPNEGKTLMSASIAYQLAASGVRTLLIDADLRRSTLTQQMGLDRAPGLLDAIMRGQSFETHLVRDATTGLVVLPAGGAGNVTLSAAEALSAPGVGQRLARLKSYFDTIIIDVPPLLPVIDARILADEADQIVMVTTWGKTSRQIVRRGIHLLGANSTKLVGVLINQVDVIEHAKSFGYEKGRRRARAGGASTGRQAA